MSNTWFMLRRGVARLFLGLGMILITLGSKIDATAVQEAITAMKR